ncbi:MAG: glycerophosphodiester phosphodiesterase [Candidatus Lokiarchaeota archaeon]|nr:glycerophosphodiester phosphodiesterase [Candidatus Harpocratesius repetitus]
MDLPAIRKTFSISIHAHRGYSSKYPENTLLAFEKAIELKADYIELDVHSTSDNKIVVIHDYKTGRVASKDLVVSESTLEELKALDFTQGQKIPTLREVLELCQGKIGINIEIKQKGITSQVNELIKEFNMEKDIIISSFLHEELIKFKKINPDLVFTTLEPTGGNIWAYLFSIFNKKKFLINAQTVEAQGTNPYYKFINKKFCTQAHELGLTVNPWTIDSPKDWEKLIEAGVDSIITNNPEELIAFLKNHN